MIRSLVSAFDERLGAAPFLKKALRKAFPDHWSFMLGEVALYCFIFIILSGIYLTFFFEASDNPVTYYGNLKSLDGRTMSAAYASVLKISFQTHVGLLVRQAHHWCALVFAAAVVTHLMRIFFTGAFRKPRDLNWLIGLTLLLLVIGDGFAGYSLPGDELSGVGLRIAQSVMLSVPLIGNWISYLFFGGPLPSPEMTSRLFAIHILLIPGAIAALLGAHLAVLWRQKHTQFPGKRRTEHNVIGSPLWPSYTLKTIALGFAVFGVLLLLGGLFEINPIWIYGPFNPWTAASPAQPDWYVGWLEGALRLAPPLAARVFGHMLSAVFWPGVALPGILFGTLYLWPWLERTVTLDRRDHHLLQFPQQAPYRTAFGVALLTLMAVLLLAGSDDVQARILRIPVEGVAVFYRFAFFIGPVLMGLLAFRICEELRARDRLEPPEPERVLLERNAAGGYKEAERIA